MQYDEKLNGALQQNILTLLCFDDKNCKLVRQAISPKLFENAPYREIAGHAIDFIDQYGEAIKEHLPDSMEGILEGDDKRKAEAYRKIVENLFLSRESVNGDYVIKQLNKFVRLQTFKSGLVRAVEMVEDGNIDGAEVEMTKSMNRQSVSFDAGLSLSNADDVAAIFDDPEEEGFELGIPELDNEGVIPRRKELFMLMAARGKGKSWFLTHCSKRALLKRWSVVIVTLEMSQKRYAGRMLQSFFSLSKRHAQVRITKLSFNREGALDDIVQELVDRDTMQDEGMRGKLMARAKSEFKRRQPLRIKEFPTGTLTLAQLKAWLDGLERFEGWSPDLICVDYPDLFDIDTKNLRAELGAVTAGLRGIAVERNCAMVAVTQGNRDAEKAATVTGDMTAEDISKLATADNFLTYSQTAAEEALGLARLLVGKARNEKSKMTVLITQAYAIGQFCLDSVKLNAGSYFDMMKQRDSDEKDDQRRAGRRRERDSDAE